VTEIVDAVADLRHELIREALCLVDLDGGIEITSISDVPSEGTGLGSSSTYTVGLLNALHAFQARFADAERLGREASQIEIKRCRKPIGKQDQYIAAYGGLQFIRFETDGSVFVDPVICRAETRDALQQSLLMLYTGVTRPAAPILASQAQNTLASDGHRRSVRRMVEIARQMRQCITENDLGSFGELLHAAWVEKRTLAAGITNEQIDRWYSTARANGAIGGKILGAGGGGFLLVFAPRERHEAIIRALPELKPLPIRLEPQGSKIIFVEGV
jgi:D-glycero-alpha-D-manno-heptose-7-phosphate kinase